MHRSSFHGLPNRDLKLGARSFGWPHRGPTGNPAGGTENAAERPNTRVTLCPSTSDQTGERMAAAQGPAESMEPGKPS